MAGRTYPTDFIGPIGPNDTRASSNFVGPTYTGGGAATAPQQFRSQGEVLGASTNTRGNQTPDGSYSVGYNGPSGGAEDPYASVRNDISSAWDSYLSSLQGTSGYLDEQKAAQTGIADTQFTQGQNVINDQKAQSLKDIANTTRNAFSAGNNYLGSLGAGDSSAANQYAFAINQQAGKQTGDLNNFVNSQIQQLQSTHDSQINQIAQWFAQQQEQLKQQIAQGGLQKGQDLANLSKGILDQAMQATNQIKQNTQAQQNALVEWAASNSTNLGQLRQQIAGIPGVMGQIQTMGGGVKSTPSYGGAASGGKTDIWGNPIA